MPILGFGLHILVALFFAVHVVRTRQNMYWLFVLLSFPLLGSLIYFVAIWWPDSRLPRQASQLASQAARVFNPGKVLNDAQAAYDFSPTIANRITLAQALLDAGQSAAALENYHACLQNPAADDPALYFAAAKAAIQADNWPAAATFLQQLSQRDPEFMPGKRLVLQGRCAAAVGDQQLAGQCFHQAVNVSNDFDVQAEAVIWAYQQMDEAFIRELGPSVQASIDRMYPAARQLNRELLDRLARARRSPPR